VCHRFRQNIWDGHLQIGGDRCSEFSLNPPQQGIQGCVFLTLCKKKLHSGFWNFPHVNKRLPKFSEVRKFQAEMKAVPDFIISFLFNLAMNKKKQRCAGGGDEYAANIKAFETSEPDK